MGVLCALLFTSLTVNVLTICMLYHIYRVWTMWQSSPNAAANRKTTGPPAGYDNVDFSVDQSRVDQGRVDQAGYDNVDFSVDQSRVDQGRVDQGRVDQSRVDQGRVDQSRVDQSRVDQGNMESYDMVQPYI